MNGRLAHFLGGSPASVLVRLALLSLFVGMVLVWLDVTPDGMLRSAEAFVRRFFARGLDGFREAGRYLVTGAVLVVPLWLLSRLLARRKG